MIALRCLAPVVAGVLGLALGGCGSDPASPAPGPVPLVSTDHLPAAAPGEVHLFALNDFHGNLEPPAGANGMVGDYRAGGAAMLAAHLNRLRAAYPASAVAMAGDDIGAAPLVSSLFHDEPTIEFLNTLPVAASSVGNHEFDHGVPELSRIQRGGCAIDGCGPTPYSGARFPYLAANVTDANGNPPPGLRPWTVADIGGHRIGFVGVVTADTPNLVMPEGIRGYRFGDEVDAVNAAVPALRAAGAETVVALVHDGGAQRPAPGAALDYNGCANVSKEVGDVAARTDPAVRVVVTGHTHQPYVCPMPDGKVVTQAASYGRLITDITLRFGPPGAPSVTAVNRVVTRTVPADPAAAKLVDHYAAQARPRAQRVVGALSAPLSRQPTAAGESPAGTLMAESMLAATAAPERGGAVAAFMNDGGVRADFPDTTVTFADIHNAAPFGNQVVTMALTGKQILDLLEQQWDPVRRETAVMSVAGLDYAYSASAPSGHKVLTDTVRIGGLPLNPVARYRIATNNFLASGGDAFTLFTRGDDRIPGPADLDALEAYFRGAPAPATVAGTAPPSPIPPPRAHITRIP